MTSSHNIYRNTTCERLMTFYAPGGTFLCILFLHVTEITMIKIVMHHKQSQFLLE